MEKSNPLYQNQGIHGIAVLFTVDKGITKVLLVKRTNEPYKNVWSLVGGALYNYESLLDGTKREIKEKTGIENVDIEFFDVFGEPHRSPVMRMVAIGYIGLIDKQKVTVLSKTLKTDAAEWVPISNVGKLAYDHNEILTRGIEALKAKIVKSDILQILYPKGFTIPEIQKTYEAILGKKLDRRNFRKKLLHLNLITDTNKTIVFEGKKPAKLYVFKKNIESKDIL